MEGQAEKEKESNKNKKKKTESLTILPYMRVCAFL